MSATFTITQTPASKDLWIYPNGDYYTDLTAYGDTNNYECVDESRVIPDTNTYVYTTSTSIVSDLYNFENHTTENGTINNIVLYTRAKSHLVTPDSSATYDMRLEISGSTFFSSEATYGTDINLSTDYNIFSCLWVNNPETENAWTWTDIDNMIAGISCDSPTKTYYNYISPARRPIADGAESSGNLVKSGGGSSASLYEHIDEAELDINNYLYVPTYGGFSSHSFVMDEYDSIGESGEIIAFRMYVVARRTGGGIQMQLSVYESGSEISNTGDVALTDDWETYSLELTSHPTTSAALTFADVNSWELMVGVGESTGVTGRIAQMYSQVEYDRTLNPEIRTTQCYVKVNYTPSSSSCYLHKPSNYIFNNSREVKKINFFNNNRKVYDLQRNSKNLSMSGIEYYDTSMKESEASDRLEVLKDMSENETYITLSGFDDSNLNTEWVITNMNKNKSSSNPNIWNWSMELEKYDV